ncbi:MAG: twitching motility protein PilI [Halioglobus sp.]|jgi:twitching motility protein PilI
MNISALQSLELIERLHAYDSVSVPDVGEEIPRWVGTLLTIAGQPFLVKSGEMQEIIDTPDVTTIPGTKSWAMGVAAFKGGLLPIISGDVLFRKKTYTGRVRDYCMVIDRPGMRFGITLSSVQRDMQFPLDECITEHDVHPDFAEFTAGGFIDDDKFLAILDINKLVADESFADASATKVSISRGKYDE